MLDKQKDIRKTTRIKARLLARTRLSVHLEDKELTAVV
jgi:hypothetical protein